MTHDEVNAAAELDPPPIMLTDELERVCAPRLGITMYIGDPGPWRQEGTARALQAYLRSIPVEQLTQFTSSTMSAWRSWSPQLLTSTLNGLSELNARPRHFFNFRIADDEHVPEWGFAFTEVDPRRRKRASVLELTWPVDADPQVVLQVARELCDIGPFFSAVGGYVGRWDELRKAEAFSFLHGWAKRYRGLDMHDPDQTAWLAHTGLLGINWLTLVGNELQDTLKIEPAALESQEALVRTARGAHGVLVQGGERPDLADVNWLVVPHGLLAAHRVLSPFLVPEMPEFWGTFWDNKDTNAWFRRFVEPDAWD